MESQMVTSKKAGYLYKWTNYISGWQQRYFVLESDKDTLTYYRNPDEVGRGCRGAVKLSSCQLNVHPSDQCRLDLSIPSQSICYCIRAQSARDRQDWLVAFSTAKACRNNKSNFSPTSASVPHSNGHPKSSETTSPNLSPVSVDVKSASMCNGNNLSLNKTAKYRADVSDDIREKAGQLRLFAELLNQQLFSLRTEFNSCSSLVASANHNSVPFEISLEKSNSESAENKKKSNGSPILPQACEGRTTKILRDSDEDASILEENRSLFDETCDAFLMTVNELCVMVDAKIALLDRGTNQQGSKLKQSGSNSQMEMFSDEVQSETLGSVSEDHLDTRNSNAEATCESKSPLKQKDSTDSNVFFPSSNTRKSRLSSSGFKSANGSSSCLDSLPTVAGNCHSRSPSLSSVHSSGSDNEMHLKTFFATVTKIFQTTVSSDTNELALQNVLKACGEFVLFFDVLYYTILPPIKSGIIANTKRLQTVLEDFSTVEEVLIYEQTQNLFATKHSSTQCIIWLYRDLSFMREFLTEILTGESSLSTAAGHSYSKTLKAYNGWVVRGVYAVAFKSLPYRSDFINALCRSTDALDYATIERCVLKDMDKFVRVLSLFLCKLQNLLLSNNILASSDSHLT